MHARLRALPTGHWPQIRQCMHACPRALDTGHWSLTRCMVHGHGPRVPCRRMAGARARAPCRRMAGARPGVEGQARAVLPFTCCYETSHGQGRFFLRTPCDPPALTEPVVHGAERRGERTVRRCGAGCCTVRSGEGIGAAAGNRRVPLIHLSCLPPAISSPTHASYLSWLILAYRVYIYI